MTKFRDIIDSERDVSLDKLSARLGKSRQGLIDNLRKDTRLSTAITILDAIDYDLTATPRDLGKDAYTITTE
jgi:hypothetical protein